MKKCFLILAWAILPGLLTLGCCILVLDYMPPMDSDESAYTRSESIDLCGQPQTQDEPDDENEDIDEPPLTWAEAHCAPKHYRPPEALAPDPWHPANVLTGSKP